jgi:hypothetical protein
MGFDGKCQNSNAHLTTNLLEVVGRRWSWQGPNMMGSVSCSNDGFRVDVKNDGGADSIIAFAESNSRAEYKAEAQINTQDPKLENALDSLRFRYDENSQSFQFVSSGVL